MADFAVEQTTVEINGHIFSGFSDDADAIMLPQEIEMAIAKYGADGRMVTVGTGQKGGPVTLKLQPNSVSVKFMMNSVASIQTGSVIEWSGSIRYSNGTTVTLERGTLMSSDYGQTLGKGDVRNLPFTWNFERVTPDYSSANF